MLQTSNICHLHKNGKTWIAYFLMPAKARNITKNRSFDRNNEEHLFFGLLQQMTNIGWFHTKQWFQVLTLARGPWGDPWGGGWGGRGYLVPHHVFGENEPPTWGIEPMD
jgi:hypothetical protein